jgi:RNA polymerase sigma factor (sigma-70 family)
MKVSDPAESDLSLRPSDAELAELTRRFEHRVRYFALRIERRFGLATAWRDDLISAGYWGLLKALRNRRPDAHEHELSAYVSRRVEGAVIDEARQLLTRLANQAHCDPVDLDRGLSQDVSESEWSLGHAAEDPEVHTDRRVRWRVVELSFEALDESHRKLLLAVAAGQSLAEIARQDGSSPARLQNRMSRVARQVRARAPELRRILRHEI